MRKTLLLSVLLIGTFFYSKAQVYTGAVGLGLDLGDGFTFVGPSGKYFFAENHAGQFDLGFEDGATALTFLYSYHSEFDGADGLQWLAGIGPTIVLVEDADTQFALRPHAGLDFKIPEVPLAFSASWRPVILLSEVGEGDRLEAGSFALGFRYAFD
ncbi:hypothetical protein [Flagellimonas meridianipacifica]|uniref:Uncharacterized protein n=1 Tax=Flagellimonas meridianipacifica TaxID=1080225 RepID=A0A2T0MJD9_9FLAO|nr:hypothetical protein [Allomuricauda pacifica]PRX57697.1 hypothetical protein CLV81_1707 [Allomuricauda pacifica]